MTASPGPRLASVASAATAVLRHPTLWWTAAVEYRRFVPDRWWVRRPWLPVPDPDLLRFRLVTQYGEADAPPDGDDLVAWLRWCKAENGRDSAG